MAAGCGPAAAAVPPSTPQARGARDTQRPKLALVKSLKFSVPLLEAEFQQEVSRKGRGQDLCLSALRLLIWALAARHLAAGELPAAVRLAAGALLPATAALLLLAAAPQCSGRVQLSAALQVVSDACGFAAIHLGQAGSGGGALRQQALAGPVLQAASYLAFVTLCSNVTFLTAYIGATVTLLLQLFAVRAAWQAAAPDVSTLHELLCVAALAAAYALPLCMVHAKEARQRVAFAAARGRAVCCAYADAWASLSFVIPGLAQAITAWVHLRG